MRRVSAPFMLVFALTVTFASFDWLMSLEPHWFSTIFGVYVFVRHDGHRPRGDHPRGASGCGARGLLGDDMVTRRAPLQPGALLFTFTCFWAYIAFSQFMLIWYANMPEETVYFVHRMEHGWLE